MGDEIDVNTLVQFLKSANWEQLIHDSEIRNNCLDIKTRVDSGKDDVDIAAHRIKLVVVGDGAVGKTSLLISYATDKFPTDYVPTVFENYTAQMKLNDESILLHLWDTAGQEDYDRLRPLSYPGADLVLLCYSSVHKPSIDSIKTRWSPEVRQFIPTVPIFLVGTKLDLKEELTKSPKEGFELVSYEEGQAMANDIKALKFYEISAKTRQNLDTLFQEAVTTVLDINRAKNPQAPVTSSAAEPHSAASSSASSASSSSSSSSTSHSTSHLKREKDKEKCVLQ